MSSTSSTSSTSGTTSADGRTAYLNTASALSALSSNAYSPISISGLASGIDDQSIINLLMQQAEIPQTQLQNQVTTDQTQVAAYTALSSDATQLQTAADALSTPTTWQQYQATSSSTEVDATVGTGAVGGQLTFYVNQLATAASVISSGYVASPNSQITSSNLLIAQGASAIGFSSFSGNLSLGSHTIEVTQASAGASATGTSALGSSTTISGSNDTINYTLNGNTESLTLASGSNLTPQQIAAEINQASDGTLDATINNQGQLVISTSAQGSSQSLEITGGTALSSLGLTTGSSPSTGTDGIVSVDGTTTDLNDIVAGQQVTLNAPGSTTISATLSGGLQTGSVTANELNTGNGSLSSVVDAINNANLGMTASAINTGTNQYILQIGSNSTGATSDIDIDPDALSGIGTMETLTSGQNAEIKVGAGTNSFLYSSSSNNVTGLMPGVTLDLAGADPSTAVTVTLNQNATAIATNVSNLVDAANAFINDLNYATTLPSQASASQTVATDSASSSSSTSSSSSSSSTNSEEGVLLGDPTTESILDSVLSAIGTATGTGSGSAASMGITMASNGTLTFDQSTFLAAFTSNPTQVESTFTQGASSSNPLATFYEATDNTQAGSYAINVTQAASQATATGANLGSNQTISGNETITISADGSSADYSATAGESLTNIVNGINTAAATNGVGVEASISNNSLVLSSLGYGSAAGFQVTSTASGAGSTGIVSSANTPQSFSGQDVQGTINGTAATGTGQFLLGAVGTAEQGLLVQVTANASQVSSAGGNLGTVNYTPGLAQALATAGAAAGDPINGSLTYAINGINSEITDLNTQIQNWNPILQQKETQLDNEYAAMETSLAALQSSQSYLTSQSSANSAA